MPFHLKRIDPLPYTHQPPARAYVNRFADLWQALRRVGGYSWARQPK